MDARGTEYEPLEVSESLARSIDPEAGFTPGVASVGELTFALPAGGEPYELRAPTYEPVVFRLDTPLAEEAQLRFIFPEYDAVSIVLDAAGVAEARASSATGGRPQPSATPEAEELAFVEVSELLTRQAEALSAGDEAAYLASFDPALHEEQRQVLARLGQVPLVSYTLSLAPDARLGDAESGELSRVDVEASYALEGIADDNLFSYELRYDLQRDGDGWIVSALDLDDAPGFWRTGDLLVRETPHFWMFARPDAEANLDVLEQEAEAAYTQLAGAGLPLDARYVAHFTSDSRDFAQLTGASASRYLGVALSRYQLVGEQLTSSSRAFLINGEAFRDARLAEQPDARQTTIAHELTHLALARETRPFTPIWIVEGAAVYYSEPQLAQQRQELIDSGRLESLSLETLSGQTSLGEHDFTGQQAGAEYRYSGLAFAYLVETYGEQQTLEFYRSFADVPTAEFRDRLPTFGLSILMEAAMGEISSALTPEAVEEHFGRSLAELDAELEAWILAGAGS